MHVPTHAQIILWEDVFVVIDDGRTSPAEYAVLRDLIVEQAKRFPGGIACLVIIPKDATPPSDEARKALNGALQGVSGALRCICWLVEGTGFQGAMVRAVLTGLSLVARRSYATHVSSNMDDAFTWMLAHLPSPEKRADAVARAREDIGRKRTEQGHAVAP
jgi:hypothetical protein